MDKNVELASVVLANVSRTLISPNFFTASGFSSS